MYFLVCLRVSFVKFKTEFIGYFFSFQYKLHQSTNTYDYHGNGSTVGRSGCSNPDESLGYYDINDVVVAI